MLDFPNTPVIGDLFPDPAIPGIPVWRWDGVKWAATAGDAVLDAPSDGTLYGRRNAAWEPVPELEGVNDGSEAQPGQVGEYIRAILTVQGTLATVRQNALSLNLTPGDWDIDANVGFESLALNGGYIAWFDLSPTAAPIEYANGGLALLRIPKGSEATVQAPWRDRLLISTPETLYLAVQSSQTAGYLTAGWTRLSARRVR